MKRWHLLLGASYILTAAGGFIIGAASVEKRIKAEYVESNRAFRESLERAYDLKGDRPEATEADLDDEAEALTVIADIVSPAWVDGITPFEASEVAFKPDAHNPYHIAQSATETALQDFMDGVPNEYGIAYIEEEEFLEDDGRFKGVVTIVMKPTDPEFFMNGMLLEDWADRLGPSIVKDFLDRVPAGTRNPVLYVRNTRTEDDYEVTPEMP